MNAVRLVRRDPGDSGDPALEPLVLGAAQRAVVEHRQGEGPLVVLGAPGTGKTTALVEAVAARVTRDGVRPDGVLVLASGRTTAARLRDRLSERIPGTVREPLARTPHSYAFGLLRRVRVLDGDVPPRLISGPEQDRILADLLEGHAAGEGRPAQWPTEITPQIRALRGFRDELRDLLMRAVERGVSPARLAALGRRSGRLEWVGAAQVLAEYLDVTSLATPGAYDPAGIVQAAAHLLSGDPELLDQERRARELVVVDDAHELTAAAVALLRVLVPPGGDLVLVGDPDVTTQTFRGARPRVLSEAPLTFTAVDGAPAARVVLDRVWRHGAAVRTVVARVADRIGSAGVVEHRGARAAAEGDGAVAPVEVHLWRSPGQEAAFVVRCLRAHHLVGGIGWGSMAVITRSPRSADAMRRALTAGGVPVAVPTAERPVRDEPAVRPLLTVLRCAVAARELTPAVAIELISGPLGGADAVRLRRLRQALRAGELATGGTRASDVLLAAVIDDDLLLAGLPAAVSVEARRVAKVIAAARAAAFDDRGLLREDVDAETVLWAVWQASGLADSWRRAALAGGASGQRADRDLDAVVALFEAAGRFVERMPGAGLLDFVNDLESQAVPADTLAERAPQRESVALVSPHAAAGREWDVVVVTGVQEGAWPDLRLRSSLLGAQALADLLDDRAEGAAGGIAAQRRAVLDDELRLFHVAVSRARRHLVVTAVSSEDDLPSPFLDLLGPWLPTERQLSVVPRALSLPALTASLRSVVADPGSDQSRRGAAARQLARLVEAGVPGADPQDWFGVTGLTDEGPLRAPDAQVSVSPSKVESFTRCALRWLLEQSGGTVAGSRAQGVGTLLHEIARDAPEGGLARWRELLDERWSSVGLGENWVGRAERTRADAMLVKLADYVAASAAQGRTVVAVERSVQVDVGRARIRGQVDRLERDEQGRLVVVDLKTGKTPAPKADMARQAQLGVYQVTVREGGFAEDEPGEPVGDPEDRPGGAVLVHVGTPSKGVILREQTSLEDDEDPRWAHELVENVAEGMAASTFVASANTMCRTCPVSRSCPLQPEGRQVSE